MTRIIAIGEAMVEMAPTEVPGTFTMGFAGDTLNTAWYLRRLLPPSDQVDYLTAVGTDALSDQMVGFLQSSGIGTDHVMRRADRTVGLYMIQLHNAERSFSYWRGQSAARTLAQDEAALTSALATAQIAYFSGITIAILPDEDRSRLLSALGRFKSTGGEVVFDPNLRPRLWASSQQMTQDVMRAAAVSTTILPSYEDEAAWFGDADPVATARRYAACGARTVIVKNGPGQIIALHDGCLIRQDPVAVTQIVDTTAAGDSFNAGFLAARIAGHSLERAIQSGAALAAKVIGRRGALVPDVV